MAVDDVVALVGAVVLIQDELLTSPKPSLSRHPEPCMLRTVPMTLEQIVEETRQLPTDIVAKLVDRILLERHGGIAPEIETAWKSEIVRRVGEIQTGEVTGIPLDESLARIRKIVGL